MSTEYVKKTFADENGRPISWWSTDDNILCEDGKTLRENIKELQKQLEELKTTNSN